MKDVYEILKKSIAVIQEQQSYPNVGIRPESNLSNDLGFASLDIAQLVAMMEGELEIDPFANGATLDQVSTVDDMVKLYTS